MTEQKTLRIGAYTADEQKWYTVHHGNGAGSEVKIFDSRTWVAPRGTARDLGAAVEFALGLQSEHPEIKIVVGKEVPRSDAFNDGITAAMDWS